MRYITVLITDFYCTQLTVFHNQHFTKKDSTIVPVKSSAIKQKITLQRETTKYHNCQGLQFFFSANANMMSLCDILYSSYIFKFIYIPKVPIDGYTLSKWVRESRRPSKNLSSTMWFLGWIFKYNIKHFISCKQKCNICSHKNILLVILYNSEGL